VIGELVSLREPNAKRRAVVANQIDAGNLRFLSAVIAVSGHMQRLVRGA
jgi:hypothetical protein